MLPIHYKRFCNGADIGFLSKEKRKKIENSYNPHVTRAFQDSIEQALQEEIGFYEELDGIEIMTDAGVRMQRTVVLLRSKRKPTKFYSAVIPPKEMTQWARSCENVSYAICEQQRRRSACASSQSDQRLCCSLLG